MLVEGYKPFVSIGRPGAVVMRRIEARDLMSFSPDAMGHVMGASAKSKMWWRFILKRIVA